MRVALHMTGRFPPLSHVAAPPKSLHVPLYSPVYQRAHGICVALQAGKRNLHSEEACTNQNLSNAYHALFTWIEANGYYVAGTNREVYLQSGGDGRQDDETCITEIRFPVARSA